MQHMQSCGSCWRAIYISNADWHAWENNEKMMYKVKQACEIKIFGGKGVSQKD